MFAALSSIADAAWKDAAGNKHVHTTDDEELAHLTKYIQRIEDTKLRLLIDRAMEFYYRVCRDDVRNFDNDFYSITSLPYFAENRYGVHLKRTNEFAIYSFFVFDDGRTSDSSYRSDPTFEQEGFMDPLSAVLDERKLNDKPAGEWCRSAARINSPAVDCRNGPCVTSGVGAGGVGTPVTNSPLCLEPSR